MNKFLISLLFVFSMCLSAESQEINYRPYIATRMAKILMQKDNKPDDNNEELCDGSGWITHGDGHKTECPGCSACKDKQPDANVNEEICQCGCGKKGCKCQENGECFPIQSAKLEEPTLYVYYMGAKWCGPCQKMKQETLTDESVLDFMSKHNIKLMIYEETNPDHKKFFNFYKVELVPTLMIIDPDDLDNPKYRSSGFMNAKRMLEVLEENKDE